MVISDLICSTVCADFKKRWQFEGTLAHFRVHTFIFLVSTGTFLNILNWKYFNFSFCGRYWCREMTSSANTLISLYRSVIIWSASTPGWISFPWRNDGQTYSATVKTQENGNCFLVCRLHVRMEELWELYTAKEKETLLMEEAKKVKMESGDKRAFTRWERALVCVSSDHQEVER